jgi:hypothetical protein
MRGKDCKAPHYVVFSTPLLHDKVSSCAPYSSTPLLPQCERRGFSPIQNNGKNYSLRYKVPVSRHVHDNVNIFEG